MRLNTELVTANHRLSIFLFDRIAKAEWYAILPKVVFLNLNRTKVGRELDWLIYISGWNYFTPISMYCNVGAKAILTGLFYG